MTVASRLALAVGAALLLAGCGSVGQPTLYPETGVDGLRIPTPTPRPDDFVARIDQPLLPLTPGAWWEYEVSAAADQLGSLRVEVDGAGRVAGVAVTWVRTTWTPQRGRSRELRRDAYAQDRAGNVWWLAREGEDAWRAGSGGVRAGLAVPAEPRVGDAYDARSPVGGREAWSRVEEVGVALASPQGELADAVEVAGTAWSDPLPGRADAEARRWYAPGLGVVREERRDGVVVELVSASGR